MFFSLGQSMAIKCSYQVVLVLKILGLWHYKAEHRVKVHKNQDMGSFNVWLNPNKFLSSGGLSWWQRDTGSPQKTWIIENDVWYCYSAAVLGVGAGDKTINQIAMLCQIRTYAGVMMHVNWCLTKRGMSLTEVWSRRGLSNRGSIVWVWDCDERGILPFKFTQFTNKTGWWWVLRWIMQHLELWSLFCSVYS